MWFDPATGARERETFGGVVQWTSLNTTGHGREIYSSLGTGYRDALRSGSAQVVGETDSVYWIRISPGHDVAVSRETYRPVSLRVGDMPETRILTYETLREMPSARRAAAPARSPVRAAVGSRSPRPSACSGARRCGRARAGPWCAASARTRVELRGGDVVISQSASDAVAYLAGVRGYLPPEGSVLMEGAIGLMRAGGLVVAIHAPDEGRILSPARSLQ